MTSPLPALILELLPGRVAVCRLPADAPVDRVLHSKGLVALVRSRDELTLVTKEKVSLPADDIEDGWRALQIQGPLPFELVGVLSRVLNPLAATKISVFTISTFSTDLILVREDVLDKAIQALDEAGLRVVIADEAAGDDIRPSGSKTVSAACSARAVYDFGSGLLCSQAVLGAWASHFDMDPDLARRLSAGFGAGMGRSAGVCGAVTGAFMVLGLSAGHDRPEDADAKERTFALVQEFSRRFRELHGSLTCRTLLGVDISDPLGHARAREDGLFVSRCSVLVKDASSILEKLLASHV